MLLEKSLPCKKKKVSLTDRSSTQRVVISEQGGDTARAVGDWREFPGISGPILPYFSSKKEKKKDRFSTRSQVSADSPRETPMGWRPQQPQRERGCFSASEAASSQGLQVRLWGVGVVMTHTTEVTPVG